MAFATKLAATDTRRQYENRAVCFYSFMMMKSSLHREEQVGEAAGVHGLCRCGCLQSETHPLVGMPGTQEVCNQEGQYKSITEKSFRQ